MKLLFSYIKIQKWNLIFFGMILLFFFLIPTLYGLPLKSTGYAAILCITAGIFWFLIGYYRFLQKHRQLFAMQKSILYDLDNFPEAENLLEEDYWHLISLLFEDKQQFVSLMEKREQESMDYYSMWVHQIKTPISAMHLALQTAETEDAKTLDIELFKIEQYVEMVLQYLRINASSTDYLFAEYELDDILRGVIRKYAFFFIRKKLAVQYEDLNCRITTDEKWLSFVIEQLISNALKYTKTGSIHIYMAKDQPKTLIIEDTGIGIRPEDQPRIFERGYTGYNGHDDKKASGIGLYLCKRILNNLSHKISITSEPGKGTKVSIDFSQYQIEKE